MNSVEKKLYPFHIIYISPYTGGQLETCWEPNAFATKAEAEAEAAKRVGATPLAIYLVVEVASEVSYVRPTQGHVQVTDRRRNEEG